MGEADRKGEAYRKHRMEMGPKEKIIRGKADREEHKAAFLIRSNCLSGVRMVRGDLERSIRDMDASQHPWEGEVSIPKTVGINLV